MITKLLFLLVKGESFSSAEITEVFFGVTKLFQSDDVNLRRMMYLFIKEVAETCNPDDVIIVTSSLTKDMNTGEDLYRANSMRVLAKIIDAAMLGAIERYLKQAIVDRNAFVASSALMAGLRLFVTCPEIVRRWINEVQEAGMMGGREMRKRMNKCSADTIHYINDFLATFIQITVFFRTHSIRIDCICTVEGFLT